MPTPLHCRPEAFEALANELDAIDTTAGLVRCAVAVAMHQLDDIELSTVDQKLESLSESIAERLRSDDPRAVLAHGHEVLFDEARFAGNVEDYDNPANSYLPKVLDEGKGLPITLSLIYKAVMEPLGLRVTGVNTPGHFLVAVHRADPLDADRVVYVDPFNAGRVLTAEQVFKMIEQIAGGAVKRDAKLMATATHPQWLVRIIQNLVIRFDKSGQTDDMHAMLEMRALVESIF
jgi:regulator of sirC expression with transglutaminase-like and TPR domain